MAEKMLYSKNYKDDIDFDYAISLSDLLLIDDFKLNNPESVERILYENGIETSQGWNTDKCLHRNLQNKVVDTLRFCGKMRTDKDWLSKKVISTEDMIRTCSDASLRLQLKGMNRQPQNTNRVIEVTEQEWNTKE